MKTRRPPVTLMSTSLRRRRIISTSVLRACTMSRFARRSATMSGGRSPPPVSPAGPGRGAPGTPGDVDEPDDVEQPADVRRRVGDDEHVRLAVRDERAAGGDERAQERAEVVHR